MKRALPVTAVFLDVGGVLLTNGWDHLARKRAARNFNLNWTEMDERHRLVFETHEEGIRETEQTTLSGDDRMTAEVVTQL
jgi:putative hydrolase of the HAD superfamily